MKILMIRPRPQKETIGLQHVMIVKPMELEVLGALRQDHDEVVVVDMIIETEPLGALPHTASAGHDLCHGIYHQRGHHGQVL